MWTVKFTQILNVVHMTYSFPNYDFKESEYE